MVKSIAIALAATLSFAASTAHSAYDDATQFVVEEAPGKAIKVFSNAQLKADFPNILMETLTPWTEDGIKIKYRGPLLEEVLRSGGLDKLTSVQIMAYNDFWSEITLDEIRKYKPILAIERNCTKADVSANKCKSEEDFRPIELNEKGPNFIVWPLADLPEYYVPARAAIWVFYAVAARPMPK